MTRKSALPHKSLVADLRSQYQVTLQVGLTLSLLITLFAFRVPFQPEAEFDIILQTQELVSIEEIEQTHQIESPPPPPRPQIPIPVADETVLQDDVIEFDSEIVFDQRAAVPPPPPLPPPPVEEIEDESEIFVVVEEMPYIIGGIDAVYKALTYPEMARRANIQGRVAVQIVVEPDGTPSSPTILRSAGTVLDRAAVDAIMSLQFSPGKQRGVPVRVRFTIPVTFQLRDSW